MKIWTGTRPDQKIQQPDWTDLRKPAENQQPNRTRPDRHQTVNHQSSQPMSGKNQSDLAWTVLFSCYIQGTRLSGLDRSGSDQGYGEPIVDGPISVQSVPFPIYYYGMNPTNNKKSI